MPSPLLGISPKTLCTADTASGATSLAPSPPSFNHKKEISEPGMAAHRCHPSIREGEARALPQISLDYVVRPSVPAPPPQNKRGKRKWLNGKNTHCLSFTPRTPRTKSLLFPSSSSRLYQMMAQGFVFRLILDLHCLSLPLNLALCARFLCPGLPALAWIPCSTPWDLQSQHRSEKGFWFPGMPKVFCFTAFLPQNPALEPCWLLLTLEFNGVGRAEPSHPD